jgi:probable rRNA maturation factor
MAASTSTLLFRHPSRGARRAGLRSFLADLAAGVCGGRGVVCLVTTDAELRRLNRQFRGKDYATDVLSFPSAGGGPELGEIAISYDRAAEQAARLGHSVDDELRILMLHGALHLTGLDHETDRGEMARRESHWRKRFGLPEGLIERARA